MEINIDVGLGKIIKIARLKKKITQRRLAEELGLSHGYIPRIEHSNSIVLKEGHLLVLSKFLDIPLEVLRKANALEKRKREEIKPLYPKAYLLGQRILSVMNENDRNSTLGLFEKRLILFNEDLTKLAYNFSEFLLARLSLEDKPKNGLRPLKHYFEPWSSEIEEWQPEQQIEPHNQKTQTDSDEHIEGTQMNQ